MTNKFILLVEDNPDDEALSMRALQKNPIGGGVVVARDGVEAIEFLFGIGKYIDRDPRALPAVVLLDLKLPRMDGIEVLRQVRADARTRLLPVVMLTSSIEQEDRCKSYGLGANSYIRKPVDFNQFMETVRQLVQYWLVLNEAPPLEMQIPCKN